MKKVLIGLIVLTLIVSGAVYATRAGNVSAHDHTDRPTPNHHQDQGLGRTYNPDGQLSRSSCGTHLGDPVIDVEQTVENDADSGVAGNYWAFDYYTRHITVWATPSATPNTYCAIVTYNGNFYSIPGQIGPGDTPVGALINTNTDEPVHGMLSGGRRATIVGTLLTSPTWKTHGSVGTTNYQCDITANCPGYVSWTDQYFAPGYTYTDNWWGWKYDGGSHGMWLNVVTGNTGNIL